MENREIKFRSWNGEEMKDSFIIARPQFANALSIMTSEKFAKENYKLKEWKVMQFTGFKDKNGKDIYEGDIVKIKKIDGTTYNAQIKFFNGAFCIHTNTGINPHNIEGYNVIMHIDFDWKDQQPFYEVIGNIYENPGLLVSSN